jgi:hypothetical protein
MAFKTDNLFDWQAYGTVRSALRNGAGRAADHDWNNIHDDGGNFPGTTQSKDSLS